jgi:hypothetical protein
MNAFYGGRGFLLRQLMSLVLFITRNSRYPSNFYLTVKFISGGICKILDGVSACGLISGLRGFES